VGLGLSGGNGRTVWEVQHVCFKSSPARTPLPPGRLAGRVAGELAEEVELRSTNGQECPFPHVTNLIHFEERERSDYAEDQAIFVVRQ
jgi:hypothetical protein